MDVEGKFSLFFDPCLNPWMLTTHHSRAIIHLAYKAIFVVQTIQYSSSKFTVSSEACCI